ncbi:NADH:ubiquinone oxidoreductase [Tulasnella sp. 425]|nr:NADH:ubiquinone oxidoreductase [Tulasnella sp. 425]
MPQFLMHDVYEEKAHDKIECSTTWSTILNSRKEDSQYRRSQAAGSNPASWIIHFLNAIHDVSDGSRCRTEDAISTLSRWRRALTTFGWVTLVTVLGTTATFMYTATQGTHPPPCRNPFDKDKKTAALLGSGWAATTMLHNVYTEDYNVVSLQIVYPPSPDCNSANLSPAPIAHTCALVSPRNYFLFTPPLPSIAAGILEACLDHPIYPLCVRHKAPRVSIYEAEARKVNPNNK